MSIVSITTLQLHRPVDHGTKRLGLVVDEIVELSQKLCQSVQINHVAGDNRIMSVHIQVVYVCPQG